MIIAMLVYFFPLCYVFIRECEGGRSWLESPLKSATRLSSARHNKATTSYMMIQMNYSCSCFFLFLFSIPCRLMFWLILLIFKGFWHVSHAKAWLVQEQLRFGVLLLTCVFYESWSKVSNLSFFQCVSMAILAYVSYAHPNLFKLLLMLNLCSSAIAGFTATD